MAGSIGGEYGAAGGSQSVESLAEWRSCDQVENGTPSTSPPYWDTDDEDDSGPKPSALYGKYTWKIENFSEISKRELRSNAFEVGGYKWYILIYPQGCDVCNHLSLFLCVANHDKLLPGWSHFAQFTIAVVNKDLSKNKYSDTLHRFWKKEHDWGWKKFMELSKVSDGFIDEGTLTIKAQVQVIREKAHRPFRCLDCHYRRDLIRIYLSNVEQTCRRFVEDRRSKLKKLIDDKVKWSSFRAFWFGIDLNTKRRMSRDKKDAILKIVVKHFFIEKEVTSTLVMDCLYSGLRALECQSKKKKGTEILLEEELPTPMVFVEKDMFILADDVFLLLERAASELPHQPTPPKDDKGLQNRTKDGSSGEENSKDTIRNERRLTELGRRTVEFFVLVHIFSRIEIAYQEAVALKRQEELIREEEAAGQAENELKAKRCPSEKEKRNKKKQAKQRRTNRKGKDKDKSEKSVGIVNGKHRQQAHPSDERILEDFSSKEVQPVNEKIEARENISDVSELGDDGAEALQPDLEDRDISPRSWDTDTSESHPATEASSIELQNGQAEKKSPSIMDDSSSTCSTDSVPSVVVNGPYKGNSLPNSSNNPNRGKKQRNKAMQTGSTFDAGRLHDATDSCRVTGPEQQNGAHSLNDQRQWFEQHRVRKEERVLPLQKKLIAKDQAHVNIPSESRTKEQSSIAASLNQKPPTGKQNLENNTSTELACTRGPTSNTPTPSEKSISLLTRSQIPSKCEASKNTFQPKTLTTLMSRPSSAPLIPGPRPASPLVSKTQTTHVLSHTQSSVARLVTEASPSVQNFQPQSYRNAIMGIKTPPGSGPACLTPKPSSSSPSQYVSLSQATTSCTSSSNTQFLETAPRKASFSHGFTFGTVRPESLHNQHDWSDDSHRLVNDNTRICNNGDSALSSHYSQGAMPDEFPHLDIINELLDEDQCVTRRKTYEHHYLDCHSQCRQSALANASTMDIGTLNGYCLFDQPEQYYDEMYHRVYGSSSTVPFNGLIDTHAMQLDLAAYCDGQIDAVFQNQWPNNIADLSMLNFGGNAIDVNGYSYQFPGYSPCDVSGYDMIYGPANGL